MGGVYEYRATVVKVVDGDTVHALVDLGFAIHVGMKLRLLGINAPEMSTVEGKAARLHLINLLVTPSPASVRIRTVKDRQEKYGRYLAELWLESGLIDGVIAGISLNDQMVLDGHAVRYQP